MHTTTCLCGTVLHAEDRDALVPVALDHFQRLHPELGITEINVRDYLAAEARLSDAIERLPAIGTVDVQEADADRLDDLLQFFDRDAFAGNPAWASCYCMCHHVVGDADVDWSQRSAATNRADLIARIRAGATTGLLAYVDGRVAGWVNASLRSTFPEHRGQDARADDAVGSVMCFIVAPPYRRHGIALRLLDGACAAFRRRGVAIVQGYPRKALRGDDGSAYHGPLALFREAGFRQTGATDRYYIVDKELA